MKKKRQSEPCGDIDNESTESCDDNQNKTNCNHIQKAVDLNKIRKVLKGGLDSDCSECLKNNKTEAEPELDDFEYDRKLWLCFKCGNQGCGRMWHKHALEHFKRPHSDCHALCVNTTSWSIWCYECDSEVVPNSSRKLLEAFDYIKKQARIRNSPKMESFNDDSDETKIVQNENKINNIIAGLPRVRGLANLGNTCFFNAVLQCLAQTPFLVTVLKEMCDEGETFRLPGGTFKFKDKIEELLPIEGALSSWGPLTESLTNILEDLKSSGGVVTPRNLLTQLSSKMPQFGGGDQEDSHELLRHLLEAVRTEDLKRYRKVILNKYNLKTSVNPAIVDEETAQKLKFYDSQVSDMILRPEQVFRGVLISTLQCQDCNHVSVREETFLDLSLPIMPDKPQPPIMRRKSELEEDNKPSKHQLKKEKKIARRARKSFTKADGETITETNATNGGESEESDADVEDNLDEGTKVLSTLDDEKVDSPEKVDKNYDVSHFKKFLQPNEDTRIEKLDKNYDCSNYKKFLQSNEDTRVENADKTYDCSYFRKLFQPNEDTRVTLNSSDEHIVQTKPGSDNTSECSYLSSPDMPQTTENRNDPSPDEIANDKPVVIALGWPGETKSQDIFHIEPQPSPYIDDNRLNSSWSSTVGARYQCEDNECSIQSCLNQFTSVELMTGNNKVCCEVCTKRINGKDGKNVYTNSTKQLLIASPPPVLILHLKRFQVFRSLFRKMTKPVTFPLVLDMAPFCSNKCKNLPTINNQQKRLLYSLYGIVEHSGTLHGGHYVAYVKVRPQLKPDDYRWQFLQRSTIDKINNATNNDVNITEPLGKWYYVSDSHVSECHESRVLKAQAYLLFYERIL